MKGNDRLELATWAMDKARGLGAAEVAVNVTMTRDIEVSMRERKLDTLKESTQNSLSVDLMVDGRYSAHNTNDLRRDALEKFLGETVAMTRYLGEDPHRRLPDPKYYKGQKKKDLQVRDKSYDSLTSEERVRIAREIEDAALSESDEIISCTTGFEDTRMETTKVHSNGFSGERSGTVFSAGAQVTVKDPDGGRPSDWDWHVTRYQKDLGDTPKLGVNATRRALSKLGQRKMESGRYTMLIENRAASRLLGAFRSAMTGRALHQKATFLDGKLGEKIGSDHFTWIDDPFIERGMGSRLFCGEGMATKRRILIDKGVLKGFYVDNYYANKLGQEPTIGNNTNVVMEYGKRSLDEMLASVDKGFLITRFIGGNSNDTTGDFSLGIIGAYIEGGKIAHPINEMNIAGNFGEFFNQLVEVGNDPYVYSSWRRPSLMFEEVEFSGI